MAVLLIIAKDISKNGMPPARARKMQKGMSDLSRTSDHKRQYKSIQACVNPRSVLPPSPKNVLALG